MRLNGIVTLATIVLLAAFQLWHALFVGLVTGLSATVVFTLLLRLTPTVARTFVGEMRIALFALKLLRAGVFFLMLVYAIYIFGLAARQVPSPFWLKLLWVYAIVVMPFAIIGFQARDSDPMTVVWPMAAAFAVIGAAIALVVAPGLAPVALCGGSLVGLCVGWRVGTPRMLAQVDLRSSDTR